MFLKANFSSLLPLHPPSICSHPIYLRCWKGEPLQVVFVHFHHWPCWICIVPLPRFIYQTGLEFVLLLFLSIFPLNLRLLSRLNPSCCVHPQPLSPCRLSRPRQHAPDQAWFLLSGGSTCCVCVCVCKCHKDRQRVCYQEAAKRNRGNSIGLLWADFRRGDADFQPHSGKHFIEHFCSPTTLSYKLAHIHNLSQCQRTLVFSSLNTAYGVWGHLQGSRQAHVGLCKTSSLSVLQLRLLI